MNGDVLYPHRPDLAKLWFWLCKPCDAYVGCHKPGTRPKGILATARLRTLRKRAHAAFDPLWKSGGMKRGEAYKWLSKEIGVSQAHIGEMDEALCEKTLEVCRSAGTVLALSERRQVSVRSLP